MTSLLSLEDRRALGARTPRETIKCPECGENAERQRNGDWVCVHSDSNGFYTWLVCGAKGVTLPDGAHVTVSMPRRDFGATVG